MYTIGRIDIEKYRVVSPELQTDAVIITEERIRHIQERHPEDYERYARYLNQAGDQPEYKNSVITFLKIDSKRFQRYLRTKKILYKSE